MTEEREKLFEAAYTIISRLRDEYLVMAKEAGAYVGIGIAAYLESAAKMERILEQGHFMAAKLRLRAAFEEPPGPEL